MTRSAATRRTALTLLATALGAALPGAVNAREARPPERSISTPCAELVHRLHGQPPPALHAVGRQLGVRSSPDADGIQGPLHAAREQVATPRGSLEVMTVSDGAGRVLQHLVLSEVPRGRCRLVGAVDVPAPAGAPTHAVVRLAGGSAALVVRAPVRGGTGLLLVRERWHVLEPGGIRPVLDLPVRGLMEGWPSTFDRAFEASVAPAGGAGGVAEVKVTITASFTTGSYIYWMPVEPLFTTRRTARFAWRPGTGRFVLDAARSDIYEDEIEGLFEDAEEQFLRHHVPELIGLAESGTAGQRRWLRHFLEAVADGPERRAVMEALP